MPVSRRPRSRRPLRTRALPLLAGAVLVASTACTASSESGEESADQGEVEQHAADATPTWNTSPSSVAAIGDSITTAFDACSVLSDCPEMSWATGTDDAVASLAQQLIGDPAEVRGATWNLAETGARAADLPAQARAAVAHEPELVTVLIGANDACAADVASMTPVAEFRAHVTEALEVIRAELPQAQVYVSSVPDLMRLWSEGSGHGAARLVWGLADVCPAMLAQPTAETAEASERREAVHGRVTEYNAALEEVCAADELCRYDGGAVFDYRFSVDDLSEWDWFHPSRQGQRTLAELAYERVTAEEPAG